jgi:hypothetical protein
MCLSLVPFLSKFVSTALLDCTPQFHRLVLRRQIHYVHQCHHHQNHTSARVDSDLLIEVGSCILLSKKTGLSGMNDTSSNEAVVPFGPSPRHPSRVPGETAENTLRSPRATARRPPGSRICWEQPTGPTRRASSGTGKTPSRSRDPRGASARGCTTLGLHWRSPLCWGKF